MLKKTITYTDFNGEEVKEDFFFHLSKAELVELEASHEGGLSDAMQRIIDTNDTQAIVAEFKKIVLMSYGKKSMDGKRFVKNQIMREEFESSEAYSTLFMELIVDADAAVEFMNGIIPAGLADDVAKIGNPEIPETEVHKPQAMTMSEFESLSPPEHRQIMDKIVSGDIRIVDD